MKPSGCYGWGGNESETKIQRLELADVPVGHSLFGAGGI
jgi:hypothetical protein